MWKLLIVDSEAKERERLASLLKWGSHGIALAGMAENGEKGLDLIRKIRPDIVITDIKMPVMDGVELIEKGKQIKPDIIYIVVAQYEGYEYTSKMMEYGVKYYLLKPCRQDKLRDAIIKASDELQGSVRRTAADRTVLLARAERDCDYTFLSPLHDKTCRLHRLIICRNGENTDILGQFVSEREGSFKWKREAKIPFQLSRKEEKYLYRAIRRIMEEGNAGKAGLLLSIHAFKYEMEARALQEWPPRPFPREIAGEPESLREAFFYIRRTGEGVKIPYLHIKSEKDCPSLLFQLNLLYSKFIVKDCTDKEILQMSAVLTGTLYHAGAEKLYNRLHGGHTKEIIKTVQQIIIEEEFGSLSAEEYKMAGILLEIYANFNKKELGALWLCRNVLHINEDYFSRIFMAGMNEKFSVFLTKIRIQTAAEIMKFEPEIPVANLAVSVGYDADGQHFSRVFKKNMGMSPSQFKAGL